MNATQSIRAKLFCMMTMAFCLGMSSESFAMRDGKTEIRVKGKVVLEGSSGDNGEPDADEVWETLKAAQFERGKYFSTLQIPDDATEFEITSDDPQGSIEVDCGYGGKGRTRTLRIIRVPNVRIGREWMIDDLEAIDGMRGSRTISREQAAFLKHPEGVSLTKQVGSLTGEQKSKIGTKRQNDATISLDGKIVLESIETDDGSRDADEVWEMLSVRKFRQTKDFSILAIPNNAKEFIIMSDSPPGSRGNIVVNLTNGGRARSRSVRIVRIPKTKDGNEWKIDDREAVALMRDWREITRRQAAFLKHPDENILLTEHARAFKRNLTVSCLSNEPDGIIIGLLIPYMPFMIILTLLSAYLLLSKRRKPDLSVAPIPAEGP